MMQVLTNDPIELANTLMQAPMYSTPVCVDFEDDDDLPLYPTGYQFTMTLQSPLK